MKKHFPKDILLIILLAIIAILSVYTLPLAKYPLNIISYIILGLFLSGYALMAAIYPMKDELVWWKRILGSIVISALISFLFILISHYNILGISFSSAFIIIGVLTILLSIDALEGYNRKSKMQEDVKKNGESGIYNLNHSFKDLYILIVLTLLSLTIVAIPIKYIESSIFYPLKTVFSLLIIFLSGYAFWAAVIPLTKLGKTKRLLLTIIFGVILLTASYLLLRFNPKTGFNIIIVSVLSIFIGLMCIIAFIRQKRKPEMEKIESDDKKEESELEPVDVPDQIIDKPEGREHSKRKFRSLDLLLVLLASVLCIFFILTPKYNGTIIYSILAILLILFLPGYSLVAALYPRKDDLDGIERASLSFGIPLLGLAVFLVENSIYHVKIGLNFVLLLLATFTIIFIIIAYIRRLRISEDEKLDEHENSIPEMEVDEPELEKVSNQRFVTKDLLIIFLTTLIAIIFIVTPKLNETIIRTILGLFLILFIPGYSLIAALFPKKEDLDGIERAALSFGLSIAVTPLIGLALNYTPWGIRLTPILISLSIFTFLMVFIALLRRMRVPEGEKFYVDFGGFFSSVKGMFKGESRTSKLLSIILILSIILALATTAYVIIKPKQGETFTEFYILGPGGNASGYPTNLTVRQNASVIIGIVNHEQKTVDYNLVVTSNGTVINNQNITLTNGNKTEIPFTFAENSTGNKTVQFLLYKLPDNTNIYRSLHLFVNVR